MIAVRRLVGIVTLGPALCLGCYDTKAMSTSLHVQTPNNAQLDCFQTADRVFESEGFIPAPTVAGVHRLYTPNASTRNGFALRWGIAVSIHGGEGNGGQCTFDLQVLSPDETCGLRCPLTPQPGYGDVTRKMAGLLSAAFKTGHPDGD